ncbi:MAG: hypothetical protein HN350_09010 [Phycisphaerales bacterium]|jgi:hypothetical protein|nr:hypothetical protein [Phycisphaerales bacterium]
MRKCKCVLVSVVFLAVLLPVMALGQAGSPPNEVATTSQPAEARDDPGQADSSTSNLQFLWQQHLVDVVGAVFWVAVTVILWAIGLGVLGLILGIAVFFYLRGRHLFDIAPGVPGRYRWLWGVLFAVLFAAGGAYGGGYVGLGRGIKNEILTQRAVDGLIVSVIQANVLHAVDLELTGQETPEELQEIIEQSDALADLVMEDFVALIDKVIDEQAKDGIPRWVVDFAREKIRVKFLEKMQDELHGVDPRMLAVVIFQTDQDEYLRKYPKAKPAAVLLTGFLDSIRQEAAEAVSGFTRPVMWTGFLSGLLIPFAALLVYRKTIYNNTIE